MALAVGLTLFAVTAWVTASITATGHEVPAISGTGAASAPTPDSVVPLPAPPATQTREDGDTAATPAGEPAAARIRSAGIAAPLVRLGLNPDRTLEVPGDISTAGWYTGGPRPGEPGPAVIVAHVDSHDGPGAFYHLRQVKPGDDVVIEYTDGTSLLFTVDAVEQHPKNQFPTNRVYGPTANAELRLITCGGTFDYSSGHYDDNVIVWATLQDTRPA